MCQADGVSSCPACHQRKARRACPALGQTICAVCCGTKRLTEIACPADCPYLAASREHPAAVVRRQQEHDVARLLPTIRHLTERQQQLFFLFNTAIAQHKPEGFVRLTDADVADASEAVATTLETAARGVIYETVPSSLPAQRLARELQALLVDMRAQGATVYDREAAITLRAIAEGGRATATAADSGGTEYLALIGRLLQMQRSGERAEAAAGAGPAGAEPPAGSGTGPANRQPPAGSIIIP
jgi:hypothetical protein